MVPQDLINIDKSCLRMHGTGFRGGQNKGRQQIVKLDKEESLAI